MRFMQEVESNDSDEDNGRSVDSGSEASSLGTNAEPNESGDFAAALHNVKTRKDEQGNHSHQSDGHIPPLDGFPRSQRKETGTIVLPEEKKATQLVTQN
jgi:hypothetical protein